MAVVYWEHERHSRIWSLLSFSAVVIGYQALPVLGAVQTGSIAQTDIEKKDAEREVKGLAQSRTERLWQTLSLES